MFLRNLTLGFGGRTEDDFFRRGQHVDGEGHLVLVDFQADPANKVGEDRRSERHCCDEGVDVGSVRGVVAVFFFFPPLDLSYVTDFEVSPCAIIPGYLWANTVRPLLLSAWCKLSLWGLGNTLPLTVSDKPRASMYAGSRGGPP